MIALGWKVVKFNIIWRFNSIDVNGLKQNLMKLKLEAQEKCVNNKNSILFQLKENRNLSLQNYYFPLIKTYIMVVYIALLSYMVCIVSYKVFIHVVAC